MTVSYRKNNARRSRDVKETTCSAKDASNCMAGPNPIPRIAVKLSCTVLLLVAMTITAVAQQPTADLTATSLEDLMNIEVTSVSKKEEKLFQSAAAIYVITQEEIRRSGLTSIPDLLRLVPGLDVARIDGTKWAVSARGFNGRFTNKLLVLIDGRSVYTAETWSVGGVGRCSEDIRHIKVIAARRHCRSANAVNGVISILTKRRDARRAGHADGPEDRSFGSVMAKNQRRLTKGHGKYFNRSGLVNAAGNPATIANALLGAGLLGTNSDY